MLIKGWNWQKKLKTNTTKPTE